MARRRNKSAFEGLIDIAALFPWWAGILFALVTYFILHHYATAEIASSLQPGQASSFMINQAGKTLAMIGQYLIPFAFVIGAGVSAYRRHQRCHVD